MFFITWLSGTATFLDAWLMIVLSYYLLDRWKQRFSVSYCLGFSLWLYVLGHTMERGWSFYLFVKEPHNLSWADIAHIFPIAGSFWYVVGTLIVGIALLKLQKTFSESYIGGTVSWLVPLIISSLIPLVLAYLF